MDKREILLRNIEDEKIKLIDCEFDSDYEENWKATFELNQKHYRFFISIYEHFEDKIIKLSCKEGEMKKNEKERQNISLIGNKLIHMIKEAPQFKLKLMLKQLTFDIQLGKYFILNMDQFEERKRDDYLLKHQEKINKILQESFSCMKASQEEDDHYFLVVKEKDELPLANFLINEGYMEKIGTYDQEDYLKLITNENKNQLVFFEHFTNEMKTLGYSLYFDNEVFSANEYWYDQYNYYDEFEDEEDENKYEKYYNKK